MAKNILDNFSLSYEKERHETVVANINNGVVFKGTNLWILIFAILIASLGLNVNSTAVIIGAMLISPMMGPIMGIGLGIGINDLALLKKALRNYFFASGTGLATSFFYFLVTPLNEAHSEILARISPNIYDVLIAFFGGFAGIIATSSKLKGNVIPGVAIATALMPPLCTAGFGLATLRLNFLFGALYLFIINTVFIALATFITVRLLKFPKKHLATVNAEKKARRLIIVIAVITVLPSIYFAYDIVQQNEFTQKANKFIEMEANFTNDYLLKKTIDAKAQTIELIYGGKEITADEIEGLKNKLQKYGLPHSTLDVKQGFAYLSENNSNTNTSDNLKELNVALLEKDQQINTLRDSINKISKNEKRAIEVFNEMKVLYPTIINGVVKPSATKDSTQVVTTWNILIQTKRGITRDERDKMKNWLNTRLQPDSVSLIFTR